ncbi:UNVERIFIED_CONTAM: hypothetical protein HDU68_002739 [Siphonaria sp. JEL0065]|nr:hypothetical protein HDU68_002739 [Siphonaria sp. JEL0065]
METKKKREKELLKHVLVQLFIADSAAAWTSAGFHVSPNNIVTVGNITITLLGNDNWNGKGGIVAWAFEARNDPVHADTVLLLDSLHTQIINPLTTASSCNNATTTPPVIHPNRVVGIDHIVITSPNLLKTVAVFATLGLRPKRIVGDHQMIFFKSGDVVIELIHGIPQFSNVEAQVLKETRFWGITFTTSDFDETVRVLGPLVKTPKDAVQGRGRRIVTLIHQNAGISVNTAFVSLPDSSSSQSSKL